MHILIAGICGFAGSRMAEWFLRQAASVRVTGIDNFMRPGSETNRLRLRRLGVDVRHGDVRCPGDFEALPNVDWVIDAAANPSVLAGVDGKASSRQLVEHNLFGTINLLEYCRCNHAGFVMPSTSRVYSILALGGLPLEVHDRGYALNVAHPLPDGVTTKGITEAFPTTSPISLYGSTKLASEAMALEYGAVYDFPVWINRCGVLAGAGQFGTPDQGIFSYWIHAYAKRESMKYIGFDGLGHQVRDALHPDDLADLIWKQMHHTGETDGRVFNVGGGMENAMSLARLSDWCKERLGPHHVGSDTTPRAFDIPWMVMDSSRAARAFGWKVSMKLPEILEQIAEHALNHPDWLDLSRC